MVGFLTELYQTASLPLKPGGGGAQSAFQQSDFYDNQLGRSLGATKPKSCYDACKKAMGGIRHPEGPGTSRPFGPFHPTAPGPMPTFGDVFGNVMPPNWGR